MNRLDPQLVRAIARPWDEQMISTAPVDKVRAETALASTLDAIGYSLESVYWCGGPRELAEQHQPSDEYLLEDPVRIEEWVALERLWLEWCRPHGQASLYDNHLPWHDQSKRRSRLVWNVAFAGFREAHPDYWTKLEGALWHREIEDRQYSHQELNLEWRHHEFPLWDTLLGPSGPFADERAHALRLILSFAQEVPWWVIGADRRHRARALLLERPTEVHFYAGMIDRLDGPAISFADGESAYALRGSTVTQLELQAAQQRAVAAQVRAGMPR